MLFSAAAYDYRTKSKIPGQQWHYPTHGTASHRSGSHVRQPFGLPFEIQRAPQVVTLYVTASDDDCPDFPYLPGQGLCAVGSYLPDDTIPVVGHGEIDDRVWADAAADVTLPETLGDYFVPFKLDSGNWGISYWMHGHIEGTVRPATVSVSAPTTWTPPARSKMSKATIRQPGQVEGLGDPKSRLELLTLAPDGAVYRRIVQARELGPANSGWAPAGGPVSGPLTAIQSDDGRVDLFAATAEGTVTHARWQSFDGNAVPSWHDLGGRVRGDITAVARHDRGVDLVAVGPDGDVQYRVLARGGDPRWVNLGGQVKGPVAAHAGIDGLHLCAVGHDGVAYHCRLPSDERPRERMDWRPLGGPFTGPLVTTPRDDGGFVLFAFNEDRTVYAKTWDGRSWAPSGPNWENLGLLDELGLGQEWKVKAGTNS